VSPSEMVRVACRELALANDDQSLGSRLALAALIDDLARDPELDIYTAGYLDGLSAGLTRDTPARKTREATWH
jgi:hypothetical protein